MQRRRSAVEASRCLFSGAAHPEALLLGVPRPLAVPPLFFHYYVGQSYRFASILSSQFGFGLSPGWHLVEPTWAVHLTWLQEAPVEFNRTQRDHFECCLACRASQVLPDRWLAIQPDGCRTIKTSDDAVFGHTFSRADPGATKARLRPLWQNLSTSLCKRREKRVPKACTRKGGATDFSTLVRTVRCGSQASKRYPRPGIVTINCGA